MKKTILSLNRPTAAILAGTIAATLCFAADGKNEPRKKTPAAKAENKPGKEAEGLAKPVEPVKETPPSEGRKTEPSPKLRVTAPKVTSPDGTPTPAEPLPKSSLPLDPTGTDVQLYPPMPYLGPAIKMASALQSPIPEDERMYSVGRIFLAYKTNIRAKNAKLPTEAVLLETSVPLLQTPEGLFARPQESTLFAKKTDPALVRLKARTTAVAPQKQLGSIGKTKGSPVKEPEIKDAEPQEIEFKLSGAVQPRMMSAGAVKAVYDAIVKQLNSVGVIGVYVTTNLDTQKGALERTSETEMKQADWVPGAALEIGLYVSDVTRVRTVFREVQSEWPRKLPFRANYEPKINDEDAPDGKLIKDPKHVWIRDLSPIRSGTLDKKGLQEYLARLNRFPGRRVDSAINATNKAGEVILDYMIREQKPYQLYLQASNTGTQATGELRNRIGLDIKQLANKDDILRFEYVTGDTGAYNSGFLSYEFALKKPDYLKVRTYLTTGKYSAEDVGVEDQKFSGDSWSLGAALTWTPRYWRDYPLDLSIGVEWLNASVDNTGGISASADFLLPYIGIGTERVTDKTSLTASLELQLGTASGELDNLGRFDADDSFFMAKWNVAHSFYLEPVLHGKRWGDTTPTENTRKQVSEETDDSLKQAIKAAGVNWKNARLAHEIFLSTKGQYVFGDKRLSPQLEAVVGGFYTVRGYPESFTAGDSNMLATAEYRLHVPRLMKPRDVIDSEEVLALKRKDKAAASAPNPPTNAKPAPIKVGVAATLPGATAPQSTSGSTQPSQPVAAKSIGKEPRKPFHYRPESIGGNADWDLIFRGFADFGQTINNRIQSSEADRTMLGVGAGLELQLYVPIHLTLRADVGIPVLDQTDTLLREPVTSGDARFHFSGTIAW